MPVKSQHLKIPKPHLEPPDDLKRFTTAPEDGIKVSDIRFLTTNPCIDRNIGAESADQNSLGLSSMLHCDSHSRCLEVRNLTSINSLPMISCWGHARCWPVVRTKKLNIQTMGTILGQSTADIDQNSTTSLFVLQNNTDVENPDQKCNQVQINNGSDNLSTLLHSIFTHIDSLHTNQKPSIIELQILNGLLYKKFLKCLTPADLQAPFHLIKLKLQSIVSFSTAKRSEECYKYLLSKTVKYLKAEFRSQFKVKRVQLDKFYMYYFGDIAKKEHLSVEAFYFPSKSKKNKGNNTLNLKYFTLIFKSMRFVLAVRKYIEHKLTKEHYKDVFKKVSQFTKKLKQRLNSGMFQSFDDINFMVGKLLETKQVKLPWTLAEVQEAALRVNELIDSITERNELNG